MFRRQKKGNQKRSDSMRSVKILLLLTIIATTLLGCRVRERPPKLHNEWGRATLIGLAARGGEIATGVKPDGSRVVTVWFGRTTDEAPETLQIRIHDGQLNLVAQSDLPMNGQRPGDTQLIADDSGVYLAWRAQTDGRYHINLQKIGWDGVAQGEPSTIESNSDGGEGVRWFELNPISAETTLLTWLDDQFTLFGATIENGAATASATLALGVLNADVQIDNSGIGHIIYSTLVDGVQVAAYTLVDPNTLVALTPVRGIDLYAGQDARQLDAIEGPIIALEDDLAYVSWNREISTPAGSFLNIFMSTIELVGDGADLLANNGALPDISAEMVATQIAIPGFYPPPIIDKTSDYFNYQEVGPIVENVGVGANARPNSGAIPLDVQGGEVAFVSAIGLSTRTNDGIQPVVYYAQDGTFEGYQVLAWTEFISGRPSIASDDNNDLYISWIDGRRGEDNPVYLISNSAEWVAESDTLNPNDYGAVAYSTLNAMTGVFALFFTVVPWIFAPFFFLIIAYFVGGGDPYSARTHKTFAGGILFYEAVKYIHGFTSEARLLTAIPNGYLMEPSTLLTLAILVPVIILAVSFAIVWLFYIRRKGLDTSALVWFTMLIIVDFVLSLLFYSVGFFT